MDNILPNEVIINILRQASSRPRSKSWSAYIPPAELLAIAQSQGSIASVAAAAVTAVASHGTQTLHPCVTTNHTSPHHFLELLRTFATSLLHVSVVSSALIDLDLDILFTNCTRLESLSLSDIATHFDNDVDLRILLGGLHGRLRHLSLQGRCMSALTISAVAAHCGGLHSLALRYHSADEHPTEIWKTVGPSLTRLTFSVPEAAPQYPHRDLSILDSCRRVSEHCPRLTSLSLEAISRRRFPPEALLLFGAQLRELRTITAGSSLPHWVLKKVLPACPNALFHIFDEAAPSDETLRLCGARLVSFKLNVGLAEVPRLEERAANCTALRVVSLVVFYGATWDFVSWLRRLPALRELHLQYVSRTRLEETANRELEMFAMRINALERFSCATSGTVSPTFFHAFAKVSPSLRSVRITFTDSITYRLDDWTVVDACESAAGFVRGFSKCPALEEIEIVDDFLTESFSLIAEACLPLRSRTIDIFIGGVQYNRW